ncbi:MAG: GntR family transcriptional regulator [Chloroflexi bacterium]|nr:GntR family transcriptional regulator [Chloroflexota bacterium]
MANRSTKKALIYEQLKSDIISGNIRSGEILNEADLANRYGTGKTPTREALLLLTHENLLDSMPRMGYMVSRLTTKDLLEIYYLRSILETEAVGLAVDRITPEDIAHLEQNNQLESQIFSQGSGRMNAQAYQLNREFHQIISHAAGNTRLEKIIIDLINDLERALSFDPYIADPAQHTELIESLKTGSKTRAQDAMKVHLAETRMRILNMF